MAGEIAGKLNCALLIHHKQTTKVEALGLPFLTGVIVATCSTAIISKLKTSLIEF